MVCGPTSAPYQSGISTWQRSSITPYSVSASTAQKNSSSAA